MKKIQDWLKRVNTQGKNVPSDLAVARNLIKMSFVMPFSFNAVELCVAIINEKPWTRAKEACRPLEYGKATKADDVVRHLCSKGNYAHKWQLTAFVSQTKSVDWPKDLQKYDI